jgi:predicted restriction endonuclease
MRIRMCALLEMLDVLHTRISTMPCSKRASACPIRWRYHEYKDRVHNCISLSTISHNTLDTSRVLVSTRSLKYSL